MKRRPNSVAPRGTALRSGEPEALEVLRNAYVDPVKVADSWRAAGGKVIGILGHDAPRELVVALEMLPIRVAPLRLTRTGEPPPSAAPKSLTNELSPDAGLILAAMLEGRLDWMDGLVIGRDSEIYAKLFAVLRELARIGGLRNSPPIVFYDRILSTSNAAARYNRLRIDELANTLSSWAGRELTKDGIADAVSETNSAVTTLRELAAARRAEVPMLRGSDVLSVAGAALTLPGDALTEALAHLATGHDGPGTPSTPGRARVFITGSPQDDLWTYQTLESAGFNIVGEDHDWGEGGWNLIKETPDPVDGILDRHRTIQPRAARTGVRERCHNTARMAIEARADLVIQIIFCHDEASGWEFPFLRELLASTGIHVVQARVQYAHQDPTPLLQAVRVIPSQEYTVEGKPHG